MSVAAQENVLLLIMAGTAVLPALSLAKYGNILIGVIASMILQYIALLMYFKWLKRKRPGVVATVSEIYKIILVSLAVGAVSLGLVVYQKSKNALHGILAAMAGGVIVLITESLSVKIVDKYISSKYN